VKINLAVFGTSDTGKSSFGIDDEGSAQIGVKETLDDNFWFAQELNAKSI
jgi:hypothetical protein